MTDEQAVVERELVTALILLREALPLAKRQLLRGGVELSDQQGFWESYGNMEAFVELGEGDQETPGGLITRIDLLLKRVTQR